VLESGFLLSGPVAAQLFTLARDVAFLSLLLVVGSLIGGVYVYFRGVQRRRLEKLLEASRRQAETLRIIHRISRETARKLDPDELISFLVRIIHGEFGYDHVLIMTLDSSRSELVFRDYAGSFKTPYMAGYRQSVERGLLGRAVRTGQRVLCNDTNLEADYVQFVHRSRSELAIPLMNAGRAVGVLNIESTRPNAFDEYFAQLMEILAEQITPTLVNATLFQELARSKTEWERTFDAIAEPMALQDARGGILRSNRAFASLVRIPVEKVPGRNASELLYGRGARPYDDPIAAALETGRPSGSELDLPHLGGRFLLDASPYRALDGVIEGVVILVRDVTRQREMEMQALRSARLAAVGMLASGVAHDFNNLMAAILLRADMLQRALTDEEQKRWVEVIARSATDGAATVTRMLDFARLQGEPGRRPLDVNELLGQVVELTRGRWKDEAQARGVSIQVDTDLGEIPPVMGAPSELREVFTNLVLNAADALPSGGRISLRTERRAGRVRVHVTDDGVGIPPDVQARLFQPFFSTKGARGTGLGLSVSLGILKRHDGSIQMESTPGRGTTFTVELRAAPESQAAGVEPEAGAVEAERTGRLLLVDDEEDVREAMAEILRFHGHSVDEAVDGAQALNLASTTVYDLILSDLGMPGMSGLELLRKFRSLQPEAGTLLVTGWGQQLNPARAAQEGIDRIVSKPVPMNDLIRIVDEVLASHPSRRAEISPS
jgi:PAS domain S-box-containing protein